MENSALDPIDRRDVGIMRFIYTFEAVWKATRLFLDLVEGRDENAPKSCIRAAFEVGLLTAAEAEAALAMTDDRNFTVHTYNERLAEALFARIPGHIEVLGGWLEAMRQSLESGRSPENPNPKTQV